MEAGDGLGRGNVEKLNKFSQHLMVQPFSFLAWAGVACG